MNQLNRLKGDDSTDSFRMMVTYDQCNIAFNLLYVSKGYWRLFIL